jgi:nitroreductase
MTKSETAQVFSHIVHSRHSTRAFLDQEVPQTLLDEVFLLAQQAPSNCNTQPWLIHVVSGDKRDALAESMSAALMAGSSSMDFPAFDAYEGLYKERQHGAARVLYDAAGVERSDKEGRLVQFMKNFDFFGAPHAAFVFMHESFGLREACDVGMYAQTLMLSMTAYGLASCPQTALSFDADGVRETLGIDAAQKLIFGISFGYPKEGADVNNAITNRCPLEEAVTFYR